MFSQVIKLTVTTRKVEISRFGRNFPGIVKVNTYRDITPASAKRLDTVMTDLRESGADFEIASGRFTLYLG